MKRFTLLTVPAALAAMLLAVPASAEPTVADRDTEDHGATVVTFDSSFEDLDYAQGEPVTVTVTWTVDEGVAAYGGVTPRGPRYTPRGPDPAAGSEATAAHPGSAGAQSVDVTVTFTELHYDADRDVAIGNAHLSLLLEVDSDGDGQADTLAQHGVNLHVEDPAPADTTGNPGDDDGERGGPPPWAGRGRWGSWRG